MKRREFIGFLSGVFAIPIAARAQQPAAARAQQPAKISRVGYLTTGPFGQSQANIDAFRRGLRELGYMEGTNILVEYRATSTDRFPELAMELVQLGVDVILATNSLAGRAVRQATSSIPIVVPVMGDPVGDGLVASLAQPGGNITGLTFLGPQLLPKRLALLKEALPAVSRVVALWHPRAYGEQTMSEMIRETEAAAGTLGVQLRLVAVPGPDELERAFTTIAEEPTDALLVFPSPMLFAERRRVIDLVARHQLPSMAMAREYVELGGLLAYGANIPNLVRRSATYVDKIIKGAKPADLPVEQPTKFELVINLKTAKALGLTIPPMLLARADEVIE